ncbi:Prophage CP4-57 integrase [Helicobacter pametensis]|nr:Prophage CP4-57 integrase [Helicobacter pametensis]
MSLNDRRLLSDGQDPAATKQQEKQERKAAALNTFEALARRWHADNLHRWQPVHAERILADMQKDVFPHIGQIPLAEVSVSDVKNVIAAIVARGANVTAEKVRQWIGAVYTYAAMPAMVWGGRGGGVSWRRMPNEASDRSSTVAQMKCRRSWRRLGRLPAGVYSCSRHTFIGRVCLRKLCRQRRK